MLPARLRAGLWPELFPVWVVHVVPQEITEDGLLTKLFDGHPR
jgi:hypothetical protein